MRSIWFLLTILSFAFLPGNILKSQSLNELEMKLPALQNSYSKEKTILDSLQRKFNSRVIEINIEKSKKNPDEDKITSLMANSIKLSNNVEDQERRVEKLQKMIESIKAELNEKYSGVIDSLKNIQDKNKENKEEIENLILFYAAKRVEVIPGINQLSFKPDKILEFKLRPGEGNNNKISLEYLDSALTEVNNILEKVNEQNKEINQVIELQRKANKFVEETELEGSVASGKILESSEQTSNQRSGPGISYTDENSKAANENLNNNIKVYENLLNQLNTVRSVPDNYESLQNKNIDLLSYGKLLKDVKKGLTEYKKLLEKKIGSFR